MTLTQLTALFASAGCRKLYAKPLSENDNSKNQVYFAGSVEALNIFPSHQILAVNTKQGPSFKAQLNFGWLLESGEVAPVIGAQLILYSQYPEVRFSGFLQGCKKAPSGLMRARLQGRVLFLGVTDDRRVIGFVVAGDSEIASEYSSKRLQPNVGVFAELSLPHIPSETAARAKLLLELGRISRLGWIDSKQLDSDGLIKPCLAAQCGGFTLEAELGIPKNSVAEPDFLGWEVKQHVVSHFGRPNTGTAITLMTPEPTGGFYHDKGVEAFVRTFGYADKLNRPDRMNFGGIHKVGESHKTTRLTMQLRGYDAGAGKISDANGAIELVSETGEVAAEWAFTGLLAHWSRKHTRAAYVPSKCRKDPIRQYAYGSNIRLAQQTDSLRLLQALASGTVYYDPGIKLENASTAPKVKRRSQFRIASKNITSLYEIVEVVEV